MNKSDTDAGMVNKYRQQLMFLANQKQQLQMQANILDSTYKELEKTKENKVYKGTGNVFILTDKADVAKETKDLKETISLKLKTIEKQEDELIKKLNSFSRKEDSRASSKDDSGDEEEGIA